MKPNKAIVKDLVAQFLDMSGIAWMTRRFLWRDRVAILLYHDPDPATLDQHLTYLRTICDLVTLDELDQPGTGRPRAVITLDDGHVGNAQLLPIFIKHKIRPTIYLCTRIVGRQRSHWWLHPGAETAGIEHLKRQLNTQRLAELGAYGFHQDSDDRATGLSFEQIDAMRPFVDFQSHTQFHPVLTRCADRECEEEIAASRRDIEALVKHRCEHFSYPNGNYGAREIDFVKGAGYKTARTCDVGWNDRSSDPFRLRTIIIDDHASTRWFAAQLTGIPTFFKYMRQGSGWAGLFPQF
jgi:peptidoglycan/xylan/chitin deacetylase (PgdA/CDA1 family)